MCDNALLTGMALGRQPVDREIMSEVCRDFDLRGAAGAVQTPKVVQETGWTRGPVLAEDAQVENEADVESGVQSESPRRFLLGSFKG
jgi:hypothetical protein